MMSDEIWPYGSDRARDPTLEAPVSSARQAARYACFLRDHINYTECTGRANQWMEERKKKASEHAIDGRTVTFLYSLLLFCTIQVRIPLL